MSSDAADEYAARMAEIRDRASVTSAAMLLFIATLVIVIDVRVPDLDLVADAVGGALVVVAAFRLHGAIAGADVLRNVMVGLAAIAFPVSILETLTPATGVIGLLGLSQLVGTIVLARLLADAFARTEPALGATWLACFRLVLWLAFVPFVAGVFVARVAEGGTFDSSLVIVLVAIFAIPLIATLMALWRTAQGPVVRESAAAS